jgi:hypothetical protein
MGKAHSPTRPSTMLKLSARIYWTDLLQMALDGDKGVWQSA